MTITTASPLAPSAFGQMKRAVRAAVDLCRGCRGAAEASGRSKTTAGEWNNLNHPAFPPLDCAIAMDEMAVAQGRRPEIAHAYAHALGGVFLALPDGEANDGPVAAGLIVLVREFGELCAATGEGLADGSLRPHELMRILTEGREVQTELAGFLREIEGMLEAAPPSAAALREVGRG